MMKRLILLVLLAAAAWMGYWAWGASDLRAAYEDWFSERRDDGWTADYTAMNIRGFPNRHDTTWTDLHIADPGSGLGWRAPFFQLFLLSYNRHHAIAAWPNEQVIETPGGDIELTSQRLRASLITSGQGHVPERANLVADLLNIASPGGTTAMTQLRAAFERVEKSSAYDLGLTIDGLALPRGLQRATGGNLPETFREARLQARLGFDAPFALSDPVAKVPRLTTLDLTRASLNWGPMSLRLTGDLEFGSGGEATGEVHLQAQNWRDMLAVARAGDQLPGAMIDGLETALALIAQVSGNSATLDVSLRLDAGRVFLGPVPIGRAPRLPGR